ncbi:hypothetical protein [Streptomyces sp. NPDC017520]|uniref:hypothetical protein n=1 Tax=Streptomyces sp. NPDC017520 TaxID=3364998 RepID=UPI00378E6475
MVGAALVVLSGCSGGEPEYGYSIPAKICEVGVDESDVKPLLPPGEAMKATAVEVGEKSGEHRSCRLVVDKEIGLAVSIARDSAVDDVAEFGAEEYTDFREVSLGGAVTSAGVGADGAAAWMKCQPKGGQPQFEMDGYPYNHLVLKVHIGGGGKGGDEAQERRIDLEKFMRSYVSGVQGVWCE